MDLIRSRLFLFKAYFYIFIKNRKLPFANKNKQTIVLYFYDFIATNVTFLHLKLFLNSIEGPQVPSNVTHWPLMSEIAGLAWCEFRLR